MGIINQANIQDDQFQLIIPVLEFMPNTDDTLGNLVRNIANSLVANNDIIVTKGVHFQEIDRLGHYHFNIQIKNRGRLDPTIHHVYVNPVLINEPGGGYYRSDTGTIILSCPIYWEYEFVAITKNPMGF